MITQAPTDVLSAEEFATLDDGAQRNELVEGRIVPMPPPMPDHGEYEAALVTALQTFVRTHRLGRVSSGEAAIQARSNPDTVRLADILYISNERLGAHPFDRPLTVPPDLVVEIVSPRDRSTDLLEKLRDYFEMAVRMAWVVYPKTRQVYAYTSLADVHILGSGDLLEGGSVLPGFRLPVAEIFES